MAKEASERIAAISLASRRARLLELCRGPPHVTPTLSSLTHVLAMSDLHVEKPSNWAWLEALPEDKDALCIVAGDVSESLVGTGELFALLNQKYGGVAYTPGNHDLWVKQQHGRGKGELRGVGEAACSLDKLVAILELCEEFGVCHRPALLRDVTVVPLFSWYTRGCNGAGVDSLFVEKEGEDPELTREAWSDHYMTAWPEPGLSPVAAAYELHGEVSAYMAALNAARISASYGEKPIVSFSHFLGRRDLLYENDCEREVRRRSTNALGIPPQPNTDRNIWFNFSRVAGCVQIEAQVRQLGSAVHVHGHQHRQRDRIVDGVRYVSHCLAYPSERKDGLTFTGTKPKLVWPSPHGKR